MGGCFFSTTNFIDSSCHSCVSNSPKNTKMAKQTRVSVTLGAFISDGSQRKCPSFLNGIKQIPIINRISIISPHGRLLGCSVSWNTHCGTGLRFHREQDPQCYRVSVSNRRISSDIEISDCDFVLPIEHDLWLHRSYHR